MAARAGGSCSHLAGMAVAGAGSGQRVRHGKELARGRRNCENLLVLAIGMVERCLDDGPGQRGIRRLALRVVILRAAVRRFLSIGPQWRKYSAFLARATRCCTKVPSVSKPTIRAIDEKHVDRGGLRAEPRSSSRSALAARDLSARRYVYIWADGVCPRPE